MVINRTTMKRNLILNTFTTLLTLGRLLWVFLIALFVLVVASIFINPGYAETTSLTEAFLLMSLESDKPTTLYLSEAVSQHPYLLALLAVISVLKGFVVFLLLSELIKVVRSIKSLKTFTNNNIRSFTSIAIYLLIVFALGAFSLAPGKAESFIFSLSIEFYPLLGALFAFLMAEIFKEGNRLREENELTV